MRLDDVDLELVQYILGGDIEGAKLAPRKAGTSQAKKAVTAAGKTQGTKSKQTKDGKDTERRIDTNKVSIWIRPAEGRLGLELDSLDLASLMHIMPGMSVRTGKATLRGLRIVTDFSDRGYHRPAAASLDAEQIDITDIVLATAETLVAATRLMLQPLHLKAGQRGTEDLTVPAPPKTIPIPIIGPLLNALSHILALTGTIPGLSSIGGALISPLTAGSGFVAEQFSSYVANQVVTPIAEGALGLITDGTFRKPRTVTERAKDAAAMLRSFAIDIGEIDIDGLSFAGQQQVQSITVKDVFLGVGFSRPTYLRHQIASLDRRLKTAIDVARPDLEAERTKLNDELTSLEDAERQLDKLESEHRWNENGLTDDQRRTMVELSAQLRQSAGATVDVGSVGIGRLSGTVEAAGLDIGAIHAEASAPTRVGDYLPDEELVARFQREGRGPSITDTARQAKVNATVAGVSLRRDPAARPGDPALRVRGSIPSSREVFERIASMPEGPARTELLRWVGLLRELEALDAVPAEPANSIEMLVAQAETLPEGSTERADLERWVQWLRDVRAHRATVADAPRRADGRLVGDWRTPAEEARRQELRDQAAHFFGIAVRDVQIGAVHANLVPPCRYRPPRCRPPRCRRRGQLARHRGHRERHRSNRPRRRHRGARRRRAGRRRGPARPRPRRGARSLRPRRNPTRRPLRRQDPRRRGRRRRRHRARQAVVHRAVGPRRPRGEHHPHPRPRGRVGLAERAQLPVARPLDLRQRHHHDDPHRRRHRRRHGGHHRRRAATSPHPVRVRAVAGQGGRGQAQGRHPHHQVAAHRRRSTPTSSGWTCRSRRPVTASRRRAAS